MTDALATQPADLAHALLDRRELLNLTRARLYLAGRLRARTPYGAAEFLQMKLAIDSGIWPPELYEKRLEVAVQVCDLYRHAFPRQYAASQAPPYSLRREQEFYVLANRHLFPLGPVVEAIRKDPSFFLPCITVKSMQPHDWRQGRFDFGKIGTACQLAQVLSGRAWTLAGGFGWREFALPHGLDCPAPAPGLDPVGWQLFSYACATEETPLRWLPAVFHLTSYQTGSVFLDKPDGMIVEWEPHKVGQLLLARRRAEEVLAAVATCEEWLDENPRERVARAVELWNRAAGIAAEAPAEATQYEPDLWRYLPETRGMFAQMEGEQ